MDQQQSLDLSKLTAQDKTELQRFINNEQQKSRVQQAVHSLTDMCWAKCITGRISSGKLDRTEETCAHDCVGRFVDANMVVIKHLEQMRAAQSGGMS